LNAANCDTSIPLLLPRLNEGCPRLTRRAYHSDTPHEWITADPRMSTMWQTATLDIFT
uniref:Alpha/beta hydrolase n=1 Tax=Taenia asiatica TaxID=60517 RepID=A0A0R3WBI5_TAEAS